MQKLASCGSHRGIAVGVGLSFVLLMLLGLPVAFSHLQAKAAAPGMHFRASAHHKEGTAREANRIFEPEESDEVNREHGDVAKEKLAQERRQEELRRKRKAQQDLLVQTALARAAAKRAAFHAKETADRAAAEVAKKFEKEQKELEEQRKAREERPRKSLQDKYHAQHSEKDDGHQEWLHDGSFVVPDTRNLQIGKDADKKEEEARENIEAAKANQGKLANETAPAKNKSNAKETVQTHGTSSGHQKRNTTGGGALAKNHSENATNSTRHRKDEEKQMLKDMNLSRQDTEIPKPAVVPNRLSHEVADSCHTAAVGDPCFREVVWAMTEGMAQHADWYKPDLTADSSFAEFQEHLHKKALGTCQKPCGEPCLCLFDVDRTLTADQKQLKCPGASRVMGVNDSAYGGGTLILSDLAQHIPETFCKRCYRGVVSAGDAGGSFSDMRGIIMQMLGGHDATLGGKWSNVNLVTSLMVWGAPDGKKQGVVKDILGWVHRTHNFVIQDKDVYYFDDSKLNVPPFIATGYNARQVSCGSRSKGEVIGLCGATSEEIIPHQGVKMCSSVKSVQVK